MNEKIGIKDEKVVSFDEDERKTYIKTLKDEFEKYKHHDKMTAYIKKSVSV